jgi:hypothetical protein
VADHGTSVEPGRPRSLRDRVVGRVERALLGVAMSLAAAVLERRLRKSFARRQT